MVIVLGFIGCSYIKYPFYIRDVQKGIIIRRGTGSVSAAWENTVKIGTAVSMILKMSQNTSVVSLVKSVNGEYR